MNLSTASKDSRDWPFLDKVSELTAAGIIVVSAIGNDGPQHGTSENPGDLPQVIGVGSLSSTGDVAYFSSRGMTKRALLEGAGFPNPDVLVLGEGISGVSLTVGKCEKK